MHVAFLPALIVLAVSTPNQADSEWVALDGLGLTRARSQPSISALVPDGRHIFIEPRDPYELEPTSPLVPNETVTQLLEARAREAGQELSLLPGGPPLLASGSKAALDAARSTLGELSAAGSSLEFQVRFWIYEPAKENEVDIFKHDSNHLEFHMGTFQPGERIEFGERKVQPFLANYEIEVANDSGVASPAIGQIVTGRRLSLRAHRVEGGSKFFVQGILDLAELESLESFETDALDLGLLQQPTVGSLQIAFSALTSPDDLIRINVQGAPLVTRDFGVLIKLEELTQVKAQAVSSIELIDLSFLSESSPYLPTFKLGTDRYFQGAASNSLFPAIPARALTSLVSERRGAAGLYASSRTILVDKGYPENAAKLTGLIAGYEAGRLGEGRVEIEFGELKIDMPTTGFAPSRIAVGRERTSLRSYQAEIAPEIWMPSPDVERSFNGLVIDTVQIAGELRCNAIATRSSGEQVISRMDANLGQLQLRPRSQIEAAGTLRSGAETSILWPKLETRPGLSAHFSQPVN